jgi:hypothetical protein
MHSRLVCHFCVPDEERAEYQGYVDAADMIAIFKAKARHILNASDTPE